MSAIPRNDLSATIDLSKTVSNPLNEVGKRHRALAIGSGALRWCIIVLFVWLAGALIVGTSVDSAWGLRLFIGGIAWVSLLTAIVLLGKPLLQKYSLTGIARKIETDTNDSSELLSTAVGLSGKQDARYKGSDLLVRRVMSQADEVAGNINPQKLVPFDQLKKWGAGLFAALLCWAILLPAMPKPILRGLFMLATPWKSAIPNALSPVKITPGDVTVAEGDSIEFTADVAPRYRSRPDVAEGRLEFKSSAASSDGNAATVQSLMMARTGPRAFKSSMENLSASFAYRVVTPDGRSEWNNVRVLPRPALVSADVTYNYPAYTRLPSKSDSRHDGTVEALEGTRAKILIHASTALSDKSRIIVNEKTPLEKIIAISPTANPADFAAEVVVAESTTYRIDLISTDNLRSREELIRSITSIPDEKPKVEITSPAAKLVAAIDETVPVKFNASDDFGVAKIEAMVWVDGRAGKNIAIALPAADRQQTGTFQLSIKQVIATTPQRVSRIEYQLIATDIADPKPQTGVSAKHVIEIDHTFKDTLASRKEAESARSLFQAIQLAIKQLSDEQTKVDALALVTKDRVFNANNKLAMATAKDAVVKTGTDLAATAEANLGGPYTAIAQSARNIANGSIRSSGEQLATGLLANDQPEIRQGSLTDSSKTLESSRKALEALLDQLKDRSNRQEVARALQDLANREKQVAEKLQNKQPDKQEAKLVRAEQEVLRQRLEEVLNKSQELNTPEAREAAARNQALVQKIEQIEAQQQRLEASAEKLEAMKEAQQPVNELAKAQKKLNEEIADFAKKDQAELKKANAAAPDAQQLSETVKALQDQNRVPEAIQRQNQIAEQLKNDAKQLEHAAESKDSPLAQKAKMDEQDKERAKAEEKKIDQIAKQIEKAKDLADNKKPKDENQAKQAKDQIKAAQQQVAKNIEQQANEMKQRDPQQAAKIDEARTDAAAAKQEAEKGNAEKAQEKLADAAAKLEQAAEANKAQQGEDRKEMAKAADKAKELAAKQKDLADQGKKLAKAVEKAREKQGDAGQLATAENQVAKESEQAAEQAEANAQQEQKAGENAGAEKTQEAKKQLNEAAKSAKAAAEAAKANDPAKVKAEQKKTAEALAKAELAARGLTDPAEANADKEAVAGEKPGDAAGEKPGDEAGNKPDGNKPDGNKPDGNKPDGNKPDGNKPDGNKPDGNKPDGNKPDGNKDGNKPDGDKPGDAAGQKPSGEQANAAGKPDQAKGSKPKATPAQLMKEAAAEAQHAKVAEQEAIQGKPEAAAEAANALQKAADAVQAAADAQQQAAQAEAGAMADAQGQQGQPGEPGQGEQGKPGEQGKGEKGQPGEPGKGQKGEGKGEGQGEGKGEGEGEGQGQGQKPGSKPGKSSNPQQGINIMGVANVDSRPESVREVGISASDWAKLPPMTQQQLLNASQQSGPPGYQDRIKNYFVKIAKIQAQDENGK